MRFIGIDPATETGFCIIDQHGFPLVEVEIGEKKKTGITIPQIVDLGERIVNLLEDGDIIKIESPGFATQRAVTTGMIHGYIRAMLYKSGFHYDEVAPATLKKFVGVTGWKVEDGRKRRLVDKEKKSAVKDAVLQRFGYTHESHNITDAYILAQMALNSYKTRTGD